jgi:Zn-dependent protease with chaperone function
MRTWTSADIERYLARPVVPVRTPAIYQAGLVLVAMALILLQASYAAMVVLAAYGTWRYLLLIPGILATTFNQVTLIVAIAPLAAGVTVTFFLLKPFLARPVRPPEPFCITRSDQPVLFAFVDRLCDGLGAPRPSAIELDLQVNASARLNGWLSLFRSDLTLTIGIPLAAGLTLREFTGVLAHEFGHFSQHAGMRFYFLIKRISHWFTRVTYERDRWDVALDNARAQSGWRGKAILHLAYGCVFLSRVILKGLLFCARVVSAWFSRQMEFNADRHEAGLVGEQTFKDTLGRITVLAAESRDVWATLERTLKARRLCDDFAVVLRARDARLDQEVRANLMESALQATTERWATHPCDAERLESVRGIEGAVADPDAAPAEVIFTEFEQLCRSVTRHWFEASLGEKMSTMTLAPAAEFAAETGESERRAQAIGAFFGALQQPSRYFQFDGEMLGPIVLRLCVADQSVDYWKVLEESLIRNAALEFMRAGGRVEPTAFRLSSADATTVAEESADSRRRLDAEIARLRELCCGQAQILGKADTPFVEAYRALSAEQEALLNLRHRYVAFNILRLNLTHLGAANAANACEDGARGLAKACGAIVEKLKTCASPLTPGSTLAEELLLFEPAESLEPKEMAGRILDQADAIAAELLGEICANANRNAQSAEQESTL